MSIMKKPVTINEYAQFLTRLQHLNAEDLLKINSGIPEAARDHTPADWDNLYQSAMQGWSWHGVELTLQSPIIGVSYWDALAYARFAGASLPPANLLQQANQLAPASVAEEWTGSSISNDVVVGDCCVIICSQDGTPKAEYNPAARKPDRTFRLMHEGTPDSASPK